MPAGLSNVVQISAGELYAAALKSDGTVVTWGDNSYGETNLPTALTNVVQISAGREQTTAILAPRTSQTITPWDTIPPQISGIPLRLTFPIASSGLPVVVTIKSGPATLSGNQLTPTGIGTVTLAADQPGDPFYLTAPEVTTTFQVKNFGQVIAPFSKISNKKYPISPFLIPIPKSTSGLPVKIAVVSGPAKITGNKCTLTGGGVVTISANQAGNTNYLAAQPVTTTFSVTPTNPNQKIAAFAKIPTKTHGTSFNIVIPKSNSSSEIPVVVTVISGPATISGNKVTLTGVGAVVLGANQAGNQYYNPAPTVTVSFYSQ